jgi:hypothetical protein
MPKSTPRARAVARRDEYRFLEQERRIQALENSNKFLLAEDKALRFHQRNERRRLKKIIEVKEAECVQARDLFDVKVDELRELTDLHEDLRSDRVYILEELAEANHDLSVANQAASDANDIIAQLIQPPVPVVPEPPVPVTPETLLQLLTSDSDDSDGDLN